MNLLIPVNVQALRVAPNDASLITKDTSLFAGPTTSFDTLPWRDADYIDHPGRVSRANISANVTNPLTGDVAEQLEAGIHLHWALPDGLTRGTQQPDGSLTFPAVPNRWLVTRLLTRAGQTTAKQWVVESDRLMTEDEYTKTYYPITGNKSITVQAGWSLRAGDDPEKGGALYYQPWRRLGRVFDLSAWQPAATPAGATLDQVLHLDELPSQLHAFAAAQPPQPLKAIDSRGLAFAAFYPDCCSVFGFHDSFKDLAGTLDPGNSAFQVSYIVAGWHSHASDDPLATPFFAAAQAKAAAANAAAPPAKQVSAAHANANAVLASYGWFYDATAGTPVRCLYHGQAAGIAWDTTSPGPNPKYPKCYLTPLPPDPTVRLAIGSSSSAALAALIREQWASWAAAAWDPAAGTAPDIDPAIERNLEFLIDALQLGLLHQAGQAASLPQLEQELHKAGFGGFTAGQGWTVQPKATSADATDPQRFNPPQADLPDADGSLGSKLATLVACQNRLDALLGTVDTCRRQIFLDWNHYIAAATASPGDAGTNALKAALEAYIGSQILDLWAKLNAAFGVKTNPSAATGNLPIFYAGGASYLAFDQGRYTSPSPAASLAGQIAAAANALQDALQVAPYTGYELVRIESPAYWQPHEPIIVATGDSLKAAQRNGTAKYLPCRLTGQGIASLATKSGPSTATITPADAVAAVIAQIPKLTGQTPPEAADTAPLLADLGTLLGEACLLDPTLAPLFAGKLNTPAADLAAALVAIAAQINTAWTAGAPAAANPPMPAILKDLAATSGALTLTLAGQPPQGLALNAQAGSSWQDPFLPLFLLWQAKYEAFEKAATPGSPHYDPAFVSAHFQLDDSTIDLIPSGPPPATQGGAASFQGFIPLSSRAADPLLYQIEQYLTETGENKTLQAVIDHLEGKPLLSQGLSGVNLALQARAQGMQMAVFNPFYDTEPPALALGAAPDTFAYQNVLSHFTGAAAGVLSDQVPQGDAGFNPLRSGYLRGFGATVVDVFGRKRNVIDPALAADNAKVVISAQLTPPPGTGAQLALPPRLAAAARLRFDWVSGNDASVLSNASAATTPVTAWIVPNHLENSLAVFDPQGAALGSLGVFGGQTSVTWQSAPGHRAQTMQADLYLPSLAHLLKFATFLLGKPAAFFNALMVAIDDAHTYIHTNDAATNQAYAVLMGRPLALVRAELRLELSGLPAFDSSLASVQAAMANAGPGPYNWTLRDDAGLRAVDFPVRLGDRDNLADGLIGYLLDSPNPYTSLYAPAAPTPAVAGLERPGPATLLLKLRPALDPPDIPYPDTAAQRAALEQAQTRGLATAFTMLIDPRARVHATTGILPIQPLTLPPALYASALQAIEVSFFTHPVLRGAQALDLPNPEEPGFTWSWTMGMKQGSTTQPVSEPVPASRLGDQAQFGYTPQVAQDGWLTLAAEKPKPKKGGL
jgi:hypothetical protein